ncbi:MAG TPA: acyltransferase domain-containing protein [Pyrinomonadaceae bacterium]|nr:acyltransferase domain-containing protein [Pyrinomonadaceae bacterium]
MSTKTIFMFSGQGSQYYSMGRDLYDNHGTFRYWMNYCAGIAEGHLGVNLINHIFEERADKYEPFTRTLYTSPAIFMVNYSVAQTLMDEGIQPDILLGYSLGEIVALAVSGFVSLEDALDFLIRSSRLVETKTPPASMLAVLHSPEIVEDYPAQFHNTTVASLNFSKSFVIAGVVERLKELQRFLAEKHILTQLLPIDCGFHSPLIEGVEEEYKLMLETMRPEESRIPVISSVYSQRLDRNSITQEYYWNLIRQPVNFEKTVQMLENEGSYLYIDAGPSGTLATFVKYLVKPGSLSSALPLLDQFGYNMRNLNKVRSACDLIHHAQRKYA